MSQTDEPRWEIRAQTPPGWIEYAAHDDDAGAESSFRELIEPYREQLGAEEYERSVDVFRMMRAMSLASGFQIAGAILTDWNGAPTVWTYGVRAVGMAEHSDLSVAGLLERVFSAKVASGDDEPEDFTTIDGRVGSSLLTTALHDEMAQRAAASTHSVLSDEFGVCAATVPLPGLPDAAALVVGACPTPEERGAMSVVASILVHSVHVIDHESQQTVQTVDLSFEEAFGIDAPPAATAADA